MTRLETAMQKLKESLTENQIKLIKGEFKKEVVNNLIKTGRRIIFIFK
jgi:hypothetical protein